MEFETEYGTIVQCADLVIQKQAQFVVQRCDPQCKHGGVCTNGECICSKMYTGAHCENQVQSSGSFSMFLYIFLIALVIAGIVLWVKGNNNYDMLRQQIQSQQLGPRSNPGVYGQPDGQ